MKSNSFLYFKDPVTTRSTAVSQANIGAIIASVLGGALLTLIVGLVVFFIWKRRVKKKTLTFSPRSITIPPSESVIVPALYDLSLSRRDSNETSAQTVSYHIYDELP